MRRGTITNARYGLLQAERRGLYTPPWPVRAYRESVRALRTPWPWLALIGGALIAWAENMGAF